MKKYIILVLTLSMLLALAACGAQPAQSTEAPVEAAPVEAAPAESESSSPVLEKIKSSGKLVVGTEAQYALRRDR